MVLSGVVALPRFVLAEHAERIYRIGWLDSTGGRTEPYQIALVQRLRELGFAEGRNLVIEFRTTEGPVRGVRRSFAAQGRLRAPGDREAAGRGAEGSRVQACAI